MTEQQNRSFETVTRFEDICARPPARPPTRRAGRKYLCRMQFSTLSHACLAEHLA